MPIGADVKANRQHQAKGQQEAESRSDRKPGARCARGMPSLGRQRRQSVAGPPLHSWRVAPARWFPPAPAQAGATRACPIPPHPS